MARVSVTSIRSLFTCALLSLGVATWGACIGGPISDFPTASHGDQDPTEDDGVSADAGPSDESEGDGDAESPPEDGAPGADDMDGGVASDASVSDAGDGAVDASSDAASLEDDGGTTADAGL